MATFVIRTILTLVRLKITTGADEHLAIPPLLQAFPGALNAPIELICSVLECSQAVCSFYICWIITKTISIEKSVEESRLDVATEIARYLRQQQENNKRNEEKSLTIKSNDSKNDSIEKEKKHGTGNGKETVPGNSVQPLSTTKQSKGQSVPLKSILHHPSVHSEQQHKSPSEQPETTENVDHYREYRKYPHKVSTRPSRPTHLPYQNEPKKEQYQCNGEKESPSRAVSDDENVDQLVDDFNNNNSHMNVPMTTTNTGERDHIYSNTGNLLTNFDQHYYQEAHVEDVVNGRQWEQPIVHQPFPPPAHASPAMFSMKAINEPFIEQPPEYMHTMEDMIQQQRMPFRAFSPTPPLEMNLSSPNSPLLYDHRMAVSYHDYGATNGTVMQQYPQAQQFYAGQPMHHPPMYR